MRDMIIVDSPGMIDSPVAYSGPTDRSRDRGYDFEGCVKWFAEKADVILLFQDPVSMILLRGLPGVPMIRHPG